MSKRIVLLAAVLFVGGCEGNPNYPFKVHTISNGLECVTYYDTIVECRRDGVRVEPEPRP